MSEGGYLYVLANSAMPDLVKVGRTNREPSKRAQELSSVTGIPTPFIVIFEQYFEDADEAETFVHTMLARKGYRVAENREFFKAPANEVIKILVQAPGACTTPVNIDNDESEEGIFGPHESDDLDEMELSVKPIWKDIWDEAMKYFVGSGDYLKDYQEALELFKEAAILGCPMAYKTIGEMYQFGRGVSINFNQALKYYKEGVRKGNYYCYLGMSELFHQEGNIDNYYKCVYLFFKSRKTQINYELEEYDTFAEVCFDYLFYCYIWDIDPSDDYLPDIRNIKSEITLVGESRIDHSTSPCGNEKLNLTNEQVVEWIKSL
ncbi:MAG: GIY-YIG nuclease family protein [bacterium]|nr:GIY-YIG nuclease family protein [bacterium]